MSSFHLVVKNPPSELILLQDLQSEASPLWCDLSLPSTAHILVLRVIPGKKLAADF